MPEQNEEIQGTDRGRQPGYTRACERCNTKKVKCRIRQPGQPCEACANLGIECTPKSRKKRKTASRPDHALDRSTASAARGIESDPGLELGPFPAPISYPDLDIDPSTTTTYINRAHYEGDTPLDEASARSYGQSRNLELSSMEQKTLELWDALRLPPRSVRDSLVDAFMTFCVPWMPIFDPTEIDPRQTPTPSLLLSQSVFLAASRVSSSSLVDDFSSPAQFYQRAKALFWVSHEPDPLVVIKSITMLHWYNPEGPAYVSYDTSEFWLKIGVSLAFQIGLHKEPPRNISVRQRAIRRRLWWSLVVRDALIATARGRPKAVNEQDADVRPPVMADFDNANPQLGQLFIAYVGICRLLGDLAERSSRKRLDHIKHDEFENRLFRWIMTLPNNLQLSEQCVSINGELVKELRPHDFNARQLHVIYFVCIAISSRSASSRARHPPAALLAASFIAGILEEFLARDLVKVLSPTFTTFSLIAGLVLLSLRQHPDLWAVAEVDFSIVIRTLKILSERWRSAIGAANALQKALQTPMPPPAPTAFVPIAPDQLQLFCRLPRELCRIWKVYENVSSLHKDNVASASLILSAQDADTAPQLDTPVPTSSATPYNHPLWGEFTNEENSALFGSLDSYTDQFWGEWQLGI